MTDAVLANLSSAQTLDNVSASKCCKNFCTDQRHMFSVLQRSAYIRAFQRTYSHEHMILQTYATAKQDAVEKNSDLKETLVPIEK